MVDSLHLKVMNGTGFRIHRTCFLFTPQKLREVGFSSSSSHLLLSIAKPCVSELHYHPSLACTFLTLWSVASLSNKAFP